MKFDEFDYSLLARYLDGDCTIREQRKIEAWASEHPGNKKKLAEVERIWNISAGNRSIISGLFSSDDEWDELELRLEKENKNTKNSAGNTAAGKHRIPTIHSNTQAVVRVAAIFLVAGLIGIFAYQRWYQPEPKVDNPVLKEIRTENGQRANLKLGDGSKVTLNAGSVVRFPDQFAGNVREVYLKGEAYFDVESDPEKPFIVHSRGSVIRVLGTSFSVRSYSEDEQVRVVVKEGNVMMKAENESAGKTNLNAHEVGWYYLDKNKIEMAHVDDMQLYLSWRKGYLKFQKEPMSKVANALERRYGIKVKFEDAEIKEKLLIAFLKSRSVRNVLDVISMSLDIEYRMDEENVYLYN